MKTITLPLLILFCSIAHSQTVFSNLTFEDALKKAKEENKKVFVFVTTSWVGPGKFMKNNTFTDVALGEVFNKKYVNIELDAEATVNAEFVKANNIMAYPTLLFFYADGKQLGKVVGGKTAQDLLKIEAGY